MAVGLGKFASNPSLLLFKSPFIFFSSSRRSNFSNGSSDVVMKFQNRYATSSSFFTRRVFPVLSSRNNFLGVARSSGSSSLDGNMEDPGASPDREKVPFGYSRKDVLLIGLGVTLIGVGLKGGLEFVGVDPLQAGNVVQLVLVLGLTVGWISTYMFRVSNKDMTYAQQLRDYENKVMEIWLELEISVALEENRQRRTNAGAGEGSSSVPRNPGVAPIVISSSDSSSDEF